jgi:hypothetical protein
MAVDSIMEHDIYPLAFCAFAFVGIALIVVGCYSKGYGMGAFIFACGSVIVIISVGSFLGYESIYR